MDDIGIDETARDALRGQKQGAIQVLVDKLAEEPDSTDRAKDLFRWSILYLFGICLLLIVSRQSAAVLFDLQIRGWLTALTASVSGIAS